ncbi:MAG: DivIVA domain-containing protein [Candidatus Kryptoniota bacterium]
MIFLNARIISLTPKGKSRAHEINSYPDQETGICKKIHGFETEELEAFLAMVAGDFEELLKENMEPRTQKTAIYEERQNYKKLEESPGSLVEQTE